MFNSYNMFVIVLLFLIYTFIGWIVETTFCMIVDKKFVNRGFLIGPSLPIYGFGCIFIILFLEKYQNHLITLFIMAMIICSFLEYITSYIMEKIFKTRWWDYSNKKFNINGRICLSNILAFGILGVVLIQYVNPFIVSKILLVDHLLLKVVTSILFLIFIIDVCVSTKIIFNIKGVGSKILKDSTEEISSKVREVILSKGIFTRRVAKAFPNFKMKSKK